MKNIVRHSIIMVFGFLLVLSCKKEKADHRDKYIGNWGFKVDREEYNTDSMGYYKRDKIYCEGEIAYGESENDILIEYTDENSIILTIEEDGKLSSFQTNYCGGEFLRDDSLHLYLSWGGQGMGKIHVIDGLKK